MAGDDELPWPSADDVLFTSGSDWWNNACLNWAGLEGDWELYIVGYKRAADTLVAHVEQTHHDQDFLVYPVVFLYRQYLELRLKRLIMDAKRLVGKDRDYRKRHQLMPLWSECQKLITEAKQAAGDSSPTPEIRTMSRIIGQFSEVDEDSYAFRYPTDKDGRRSLPPDLQYVNLRNLAEVMDGAAAFLDSAGMMISAWQEIKDDMDQEYRDYLADY